MFLSALRSKSKFSPRTFTYFIPSPPKRKTGYQEKEFDELIGYLTKNGFEILDIKTQSSTNNESSGMWVISLIRPKNKKANDTELTFDYETYSANSELEIEYD